jgi:pyruvate/2-oxoglutarate dehydrogenase complex dihydrolipoamide dehydrogenase (E3) component
MDFDALVIGSGQAGNPLASALAEAGHTVAIIERNEVGGTCVNVGCTPTKTLVQRAQIAYFAKNSQRWGIHTGEVSVNFQTVMSQKNKVVLEWRESVLKKLQSDPKIHLIRGSASFIDKNSIKVGDKVFRANKIFIDTGASPFIPAIPGLNATPYLTNESILELEQVPESLVVLGGGYVGLEFGQMFSRFGSKVTIIQRGPQLVPNEDEDVANAMTEALESEGISILLNAQTQRIDHGGEFSIRLSDQTVRASALLVATGRKPRTEDLNLAAAGVEVNPNGSIKVNGRLETTTMGIWALGDVNGGPAFTHISYNDYQIVSANVLHQSNYSTQGRIVPYCVFTDPQIGGFGLNERRARALGKPIKVGSIPMNSVARAIEMDRTAGLMKLIVDAETDYILGATIIGVEAGELIQILSTVALLEQPYTKLRSAIWIHPTLAEGMFSLIASVR